MRGATLHRPSPARPAKSLVVRGGLARTFGSLASFLVVTFFCWGIYILEDALAHPLIAGAAALIAAAFIIALAAILLFYLIEPGKRSRSSGHRRAHEIAPTAEPPPIQETPLPPGQHDLREDPGYQGSCVDDSRIRP
jgi:hypothetical protein